MDQAKYERPSPPVIRTTVVQRTRKKLKLYIVQESSAKIAKLRKSLFIFFNNEEYDIQLH